MNFVTYTPFLLLWSLPFLLLFFIFARRGVLRSLGKFCDPSLLPRLSPRTASAWGFKRFLLLSIVIILLSFTLSGPRWGFHYEEMRRAGIDLVVAVDLSRSMTAEDVRPSRLKKAKRDIIDLLRMAEGDRIGLVTFAGVPFIQCPLTLDYRAVEMFLDYLSPDLLPVPGTDIGKAIMESLKLFNPFEKTSKALVLITDGEDHGKSLEDALKEAKEKRVVIHVIGVGESQGAPIPEEEKGGFKKDDKGEIVMTRMEEANLKRISDETGGVFVLSGTGGRHLQEIYLEKIKGMETKEFEAVKRKRWEERFQFPLFLAILLLALESTPLREAMKWR